MCLMRGHIGATWRIRLNHLSVVALCRITLTTCYYYYGTKNVLVRVTLLQMHCSGTLQREKMTTQLQWAEMDQCLSFWSHQLTHNLYFTPSSTAATLLNSNTADGVVQRRAHQTCRQERRWSLRLWTSAHCPRRPQSHTMHEPSHRPDPKQHQYHHQYLLTDQPHNNNSISIIISTYSQTSHNNNSISIIISTAVLSAWNSLEPDLRSAPSLASFKSCLKTALFSAAYSTQRGSLPSSASDLHPTFGAR